MRSCQLEEALCEFFEEAARYLQGEVEGGAEVPLELDRQGRGPGHVPFYCYRPLTSEFIGNRWRRLCGLTSHARALSALEAFPGLERYVGRSEAPLYAAGATGRRGLAQAALWLLLDDVFSEQTEFTLRRERLARALERLALHGGMGPEAPLAAVPLFGMTITSPEVALADGLALLKPSAFVEGPPHLRIVAPEEEPTYLVALYRGRDGEGEGEAVGALKGLLEALRLFGDARLGYGGLGYLGCGAGRWQPFALGGSGRPYGTLVVRPQEEDELRAFCALYRRRAPREGPAAWALARYNLGADRAREEEALSDYLLALRALLEGEGSPRGSLAGRLAALCASPAERPAVRAQVVKAQALERAVIVGSARPSGANQELIRQIASYLRALLRDLVCGHLDPDLAEFADRLLLEGGERPLEEETGELLERA